MSSGAAHSGPQRYNNILLALGLLTGVTVNVNFISSLAYFLTQNDPIFLLYLTVGSVTIIALLMRWQAVRETKFVKLAIAVIVVVCLLQSLLILPIFSPVIKAFMWAGSAIFCRSALKWILTELALRHLNPSEAKITIFHNATTYEVGTLAVMVTLTYLLRNVLGHEQILWIVLILMLLYGAILTLYFMPWHSREIRFERTPPKTDEADPIMAAARRFTPFAGLMFAFLGLCEMVPDYAYKYFFKQELADFSALQFTLAKIYMYASLILIVSSVFVTRIIRTYHISPVTLIMFTLLTNAVLANYCLHQPSVERFTVFAVVFMVLLKLCTQTASQLILSFFSSAVRQKFNSLQTICYWIIPNLLLALAVSYGDRVTPEYFIVILLTGFKVVCLLCFASLILFHRKLVAFFYEVIQTGRKESTLLAVEALSYLKPFQVDKRLLELLAQNPKKLLKINIIMSLGYSGSRNQEAFDKIVQEFQNSKEEVQVAIIHAISHFRGYERVKFLINVLIGRQQKVTQYVRINASRFLVHMYGKKTIPILLVGLDDPDPRTKADVLEALGWLKQRDLVPLFKKYVEHTNPRVRANAIIALLRFKKLAPVYFRHLDAMLQDENMNIVASGLYVIGYHRLRSHTEALLALSSEPVATHPLVSRGIAWSLTRLGHPEGVRHFINLFVAIDGTNESLAFLHLFSQLDHRTKFAIFEALLRHHQLRPESFDMGKLFAFLKSSEFDFHEEMNFMSLQLERDESRPS